MNSPPTCTPTDENNNITEEETAYEWLERSSKSICPFTNVINSFVFRNSKQKQHRIPLQCQARQGEGQQEGTGIRIFDHLFQSSLHSSGARHKSTVIEMSGSCTGKSSLAISFAVSYILATSGCQMEENEPAILPQVVIFDCEYGIHIPNVISMLRAGILRKEGQKQQTRDHETVQQTLQQDIVSCLQRIHICHPRDYAVGLLSSLEVLVHSLSSLSYPVLLIIDSLSSFEHRDKMMEDSIQSGISGKGDFFRHLSKLIAACTANASKSNIIVLGITSSLSHTNDIWNKLVTHRLNLKRVKKGTVEEREGFEFVAIVGNDVIPFSIANSGVLC